MSRPAPAPLLSAVIPTHGRLASLRRTLAALAGQEYPAGRLEVVVVCDGDPAAAAALRAEPPAVRLRLVEQARRGPAAARNAGIEASTGELVLFVDDDVVPAPDWARQHAGAHAGAADLVVIGPLLPPPGGRWPTPWTRWEARTLERQYAEMRAGAWAPTPRQLYTGNASVRREHLVALGGFDAGLRRAEDVELGFRLRDRGLRFVFRPEAAGLHDPSRSYRSWLGAARHYGAVDALLGRRRGRRDVVESAARELDERHPLTRAAVRWTLGRRPAAALLPWAAAPLAWAAFLAGRGGLSDQVCGGVFNVLYWQGMCDGLGGAAAARDLVRTGSLPREPAVPAGGPAGGAR